MERRIIPLWNCVAIPNPCGNTKGKIRSIQKVFDLRPAAIIDTLDLRRPIYKETAKNGHFGHQNFPWERTDKVEDILAEAERLS